MIVSYYLLIVSIIALLIIHLRYCRGFNIPKFRSYVFILIPSLLSILIISLRIGRIAEPIDFRLTEEVAESIHEINVGGVDKYFMKTKSNERIITKSTFHYYKKLWKGDEWSKDIEWNKNMYTALIHTKHQVFINWMKNINSFKTLDVNESANLFKYRGFKSWGMEKESVIDPRQALIYGIAVPDSISRALSYMSSLDNTFRPIILIWEGQYNKDLIIENQSILWQNGKDNEVVFCVGIDNAVDKNILWSGSFSWSKNKGFEDYIITNSLSSMSKLDLNNYINYLRIGYSNGLWRPRNFEDYNIIKLPLPNIIMILLGILLVIINLVILKNIIFKYNKIK